MAVDKPNNKKTATQPKPEETELSAAAAPSTSETQQRPPVKVLFANYTAALAMQDQARKATEAAQQAKSDAVGKILTHYGKRKFQFKGEELTPVMKTIKGKDGAADKVVYFFKTAKEDEAVSVE